MNAHRERDVDKDEHLLGDTESAGAAHFARARSAKRADGQQHRSHVASTDRCIGQGGDCELMGQTRACGQLA